MALSNAIVPVLALITPDAAMRDYLLCLFWARFYGVSRWMASDKIGRVSLIKIGLAGTFLSAILIWFLGRPPVCGRAQAGGRSVYRDVCVGGDILCELGAGSPETVRHLSRSAEWGIMASGLFSQVFLHKSTRMRVCFSSAF